MQNCVNPSVGIWWFYYDAVFLCDQLKLKMGFLMVTVLQEYLTTLIFGTSWKHPVN